MTEPSATHPSDNTTLVAVLAGYAADGFDADFELIEDTGDLCCATCSTVVPPEQVPIHSIRRLEGASDPADMAAVCAITCRACGATGTVIVRYGPEASIEEAEFLVRAQDRRDDAVAPSDAAPGEERRPSS
jgi:hypothetical protein